MMCEWNEEELHEKKKKAFLSLLSTFCLLFSFVCPLFVHLTSCFVVLSFSKAPKWREKSQKDWDSHSDSSFVHLLQEQLLEMKQKIMSFCYWPEEDVVPQEPGCTHALGGKGGWSFSFDRAVQTR